MILIIMPSLACAMPMRGEVATPVQQGTTAHCGEAIEVTATAAVASTDPVMLYAECMGVELPPTSSVASSLLLDCDHEVDIEPLSPSGLPEFDLVLRLTPIRGSPPPDLVISGVRSIYLLTNRFRI